MPDPYSELLSNIHLVRDCLRAAIGVSLCLWSSGQAMLDRVPLILGTPDDQTTSKSLDQSPVQVQCQPTADHRSALLPLVASPRQQAPPGPPWWRATEILALAAVLRPRRHRQARYFAPAGEDPSRVSAYVQTGARSLPRHCRVTLEAMQLPEAIPNLDH